MNIASYVSRHTNRSSCHGKHLPCEHGKIYSEVVNPYDETALACHIAMRNHHLIHIIMTQISGKGEIGRAHV